MVLILSDDQVAALGELHVAAWKGSRDDVVKLVNGGCAVDGEVDKDSPFYCTPLHLAAMSSRHALAKINFMQLNGANVIARDANGDTPLHRAVSSRHCALRVIESLLQRDTPHRIENKDFDTAYDIAVKDRHAQIIELFCETNPSQLLQAAAKYKRMDLVQRLLKQREEQKPEAESIFAPVDRDLVVENVHLAFAAVQGGDEKILKFLVDKGLNLNMVESNSIWVRRVNPIWVRRVNSTLFAAVMHGDPAIFTCLRKLRWNFPRFPKKATEYDLVMTRAVSFAGVKMLEYLTKTKGYSIYVQDEEVVDKLREQAIRRRDSDVIEWLEKHGVTMYGAQALEAVQRREDVLKLFIANGLSVDSGAAKGPERSLLNAALLASRTELVEYLAEEGLITRLMTGREHSLLEDTMKMNDLTCFKNLVHRGLNVHARNDAGETMLHTAVKLGNREIVVFLLDEGADIGAVDKKKQTVLHVAVTSGQRIETIKYLLDNGADIHAKDEDARRVLHHAASLLESDVCSEKLAKTLFSLISYGARWNKTHAACFEGYKGKKGNDGPQPSPRKFRFRKWIEAAPTNLNVTLTAQSEYNEGDHDSDGADEHESDADGAIENSPESKTKDDEHQEYERNEDAVSVTSQDSLYRRESMTSTFYEEQAYARLRAEDDDLDFDGEDHSSERAPQSSLRIGRTHIYKDGESEDEEEGDQGSRNGSAEEDEGWEENEEDDSCCAADQDTSGARSDGGGAIDNNCESNENDYDSDGADEHESDADGAIENSPESKTKDDEHQEYERNDDAVSVTSQDSLYRRESMTSTFYEDQASYARLWAEDDDCEVENPLVIKKALIVCVKAWLRERAAGDDLTPIPWSAIKRGPVAIEKYYHGMGKPFPEHNAYHHRVCVLGCKGSGKTSLTHWINSRKPQLEHQSKRPVDIDAVAIDPRDTGNQRISFWDIAGLDFFEAAVPRFFSEQTQYLICVDLEEYATQMKKRTKMKRFVSEHIFKWIRLILPQHPKAKFVIVGTKADLLTSDEHEHVKQSSMEAKIKEDFELRLKEWMDKLYELQDGLMPKVLTGSLICVSCKDEEDELDVLNCKDEEDELDVRWDDPKREILNVIKSERGCTFGSKHLKVLSAIERRAKKIIKTPGKIENNPDALCAELVKAVDDVTPEQCRRCLGDLEALGKVWFLQNSSNTNVTVFLNPKIIPQGLCSLIQRAKSSGFYLESEIDELSFWKDLVDDERRQLKRALQHLRLAYPEPTAIKPALIVPACWKHRKNTQKAPLIQQHSLLNRHDVEGKAVVCWEYELSVEASSRVFVQFACTFKGLGKRAITHRNYFRDIATGDVVVGASLDNHHDISAIDVIRIEIAAKEPEVGWRRMVLYVMAMEKTLREFPGLHPAQFIVDSSGGQHKLEKVTTSLAVETKSGTRIDRLVESWMPPEWWLSDWNDDEKAIQWLRQNDNHKSVLAGQTVLSHKMDAVRKLVIADPTLRQFPALWTLAYVKDGKNKRRLEVRMRSDYSGECRHQEKPIVIHVDRGCEFLVRHEGKIQLGWSILSTVVPTFIPEGVVNKIAETAFEVLEPGVADGIDKAKTIISMIQRLDLSPGSKFTSADKTLTPGETTLLLRDLLLLHDANFHPLMIPKLSGLESAVTRDGRFVWASREEIDASEGDFELDSCFPEKVEPLVPSNPPIGLELEIMSITGLDDTKDVYWEWQLTPSLTSHPTDNAESLALDQSATFHIQSEDELSKSRLNILIKKRAALWGQRIFKCSTRLSAWSTSVLGEGDFENLVIGDFSIEIKNPKTKHLIATVQCRISPSA